MAEPGVATGDPRRRAAIEIGAVAVGMVVFALCAHRGGLWTLASVGGLAVAAATMGLSLRRAPDPRALLGLDRVPDRAARVFGVALAIGISLGVVDRYRLGMRLLPAGGLEIFALVACVIGATEELIYRGWLQGRARPFGSSAAVLIAAVAHAGYKTALFVWPGDGMPPHLLELALLTLAGGILFGVLREWSKSVVPSMVAHVAFDLMVYGAVAYAPWWVWT
jgi:membrane protease YdiL (CAAX protease family)